jgi:hypothetical protein
MKTLLALLLSVALTAGLEYGPLEVEGFIQAAGKKQIVDGKEYLIVEIPKKVWEDVNKGRKFVGRATYTQEQVKSQPLYAREYLADWVNMVKTELSEVYKREPAKEEVFVAWFIGMKAFKKLDYKLDKLPEEVELRLKVFQSVKTDRAGIHEPPPPLPGDGRPVLSRRYPDDERRRFK